MIAYLALLGRIVLLGYERIAVKKISAEADSISGAFLFFATATLFLVPFALLAGIPENFEFMKVVFVTGFIYSFAFWLYVKSLSQGEASLVSPLYNFNVFFLLLLTVIFLDEKLTIFKILGLIFLVYGASFLNKKSNIFESLKALFTDRACLYMLASTSLLAIGRTIDGFMVRNKVEPIIYSFGLYLCITIYLFLYQIPTQTLGKTWSLFRKRTAISFIGGATNSYSYLFLLYSYKGIEVSVAEPSSMLSMVITVLLAGRIFKESIKTRLVGVFVMIFGAWLLFL